MESEFLVGARGALQVLAAQIERFRLERDGLFLSEAQAAHVARTYVDAAQSLQSLVGRLEKR